MSTGNAAIDAVSSVRTIANPHTWPVAPDYPHPVLLIPGFMAGDHSLAHMAAWLRTGGAITQQSGIRLNAGCMEDDLERLERVLAKLADRTGQPVTIIGHSRGGNYGRILAMRHPELVSTLITLGTPSLNQLAFESLPAKWGTYLLGAFGTLGIRGLIRWSCLNGPCCAQSRAEMAQRVPPTVTYHAMYSRRDRLVKWQACLAPEATLIEVGSHHLLMSANPAIWRQVSALLETSSRADAPAL